VESKSLVYSKCNNNVPFVCYKRYLDTFDFHAGGVANKTDKSGTLIPTIRINKQEANLVARPKWLEVSFFIVSSEALIACHQEKTEYKPSDIFGGEMQKNTSIMRETHWIMWKFQQLTKLIIKPFQCTEQQ